MKVKDQNYYTRRMQTQLGIIKDLGYNLDQQSIVLDLGCGNGNIVREYRNHGYNAYGCDFSFKDGPFVADMQEKGIIKQIDSSSYKLPFDDNSIDFVISDQVFEHVKDYPATLQEVHRVLKPGGISLHFFPSRYKIIESHVHIPFASVLQNYYWLKLWALLGIRTREQRGLSAKEAANRNHEYLINQTIYLTKSEITSHCARYFGTIRFCEDIFFKYIQRAPVLYKLSQVASFLPVLYSTLRTRVLFFSK